MKKYLAVLFGVLFLLSVSATAFAIHEEMPPDEAIVAKGPSKITLGGKMIVRGWYFDQVAKDLPVSTHSQALYTTNAYLTIDAKVSDNIRAYMELETSSTLTSHGTNSGVLYWGTYDTKNDGDLKFRQLWMQYTGSGLLGTPAGLKAGHMPISLGEKMFLNNERFGDDAILLWVDPTKELHLVAGTAKLAESTKVSVGDISSTADLNGYLLLATYMLNKDNTVGLNYLWAHSDGNVPGLQGPTGIIPNVASLNLHNIEAHANGKVANLTYGAELDIQFGKVRDLNLSGENADFRGWGMFAKVGYMLDPLNLRASFARGSGDKNIEDNKMDQFQVLQGPDAIGAIARFTHYTLIYERLIRTAAFNKATTNDITLDGNNRTTGIANTTFYNLGMDVAPVKELKLSLDGYIIRATEVKAWEELMGNKVSRAVGAEIDARLNYKIAKNLSYFVEAGMFFPGDFYEDSFRDTTTGDPIKKKTTTMAVHGLLLEF